jgi:maltose-binding protein MalE
LPSSAAASSASSSPSAAGFTRKRNARRAGGSATGARVAKNATLQGFRKQLDTAVPMPNYAEMTLMWSPVTTAMNKIVKGSATPEVALKEAQAAVTDSISKLRKGR